MEPYIVEKYPYRFDKLDDLYNIYHKIRKE